MNKKERKAFAEHEKVLKEVAAAVAKAKTSMPATMVVAPQVAAPVRTVTVAPVKPVITPAKAQTYKGGICTEGRAVKVQKGKWKVEVKQAGKWVEVDRTFKSVTKAEEWIGDHID